MEFDDVFNNSIQPQNPPPLIPNRRKGQTLRSFIRECKKNKLIPKSYIKALEDELPIQETDVVKEMWDFLERMGMFPIKFENQATFDPTGFRRNFAGGTKRKGISDLFFTAGRLVVCEVKTPDKYAFIIRNWDKIRFHTPKPLPPKVKGVKRKKPNDDKQRYKEQMEFIERMKTLGHGGFFADSVQRICIELLKEPHYLTPFQLAECSRLATTQS
jgi:hypothetical protein